MRARWWWALVLVGLAAGCSELPDTERASGGLDEALESIARGEVSFDGAELHEHYVRELPETGRRLHVFTYVSPAADKQTVAVDEDSHEVVSLAVALAAEPQALYTRCGVMDRALCDAVASAGNGDRLPVMIWILYDAVTSDRSMAASDPAAFRAELASIAQANHLVADRVGTRLEAAMGRSALWRSQYAPVLVGRLTPAEVAIVAADAEVGAVMLSGGDQLEEDSAFANALSRDGWSNNTSYDGTGVNVGVLELGQPDSYTNLPSSIVVRDTTDSPSTHARAVAGTIANTTSDPGFANDANIFVANQTSTDVDVEYIDWAYGQGTTVNNLSWHSNASPDETAGSLVPRDKYMDYITRNFAVFFAGAASNFDSYHVVHKGYNIVSVGASYTNGLIVDGSWADVCSLPSSYVSTWQNDSNGQELPHITAQGACMDIAGLTNESGTSFASPSIAGIAAGLQEWNTNLQGWPEPLKAILLASPSKTASYTPDGCDWRYRRNTSGVCNLNDGRDGTGLVNGSAARDMAGTRSSGLPATEHAHDFATITPSSFNATTHLLTTTHYAKGPRDCGPASYRLRTVLAWDSTVSCTTGNSSSCGTDAPDMDLDILVYQEPGSTLVGQSSTTANSYEHVDIPIIAQLGQCNPSGSDYYYRIEVRLTNYSTVSSNALTFYGLAWHWYL